MDLDGLDTNNLGLVNGSFIEVWMLDAIEVCQD